MGLGDRIRVAEGLDQLPPVDSWYVPLDEQGLSADFPGYLVVIDDMFAEKDLTALDQYSIRARKRLVSLCFLSQGYTSKNASFNMMKLSMDYLVLNPGNPNSAIQQVHASYPCGLEAKEMKQLYELCKGDRFLFIDKVNARAHTVANFVAPDVSFDNLPRGDYACPYSDEAQVPQTSAVVGSSVAGGMDEDDEESEMESTMQAASPLAALFVRTPTGKAAAVASGILSPLMRPVDTDEDDRLHQLRQSVFGPSEDETEIWMLEKIDEARKAAIAAGKNPKYLKFVCTFEEIDHHDDDDEEIVIEPATPDDEDNGGEEEVDADVDDLADALATKAAIVEE